MLGDDAEYRLPGVPEYLILLGTKHLHILSGFHNQTPH